MLALWCQERWPLALCLVAHQSVSQLHSPPQSLSRTSFSHNSVWIWVWRQKRTVPWCPKQRFDTHWYLKAENCPKVPVSRSLEGASEAKGRRGCRPASVVMNRSPASRQTHTPPSFLIHIYHQWIFNWGIVWSICCVFWAWIYSGRCWAICLFQDSNWPADRLRRLTNVFSLRESCDPNNLFSASSRQPHVTHRSLAIFSACFSRKHPRAVVHLCVWGLNAPMYACSSACSSVRR